MLHHSMMHLYEDPTPKTASTDTNEDMKKNIKTLPITFEIYFRGSLKIRDSVPSEIVTY